MTVHVHVRIGGLSTRGLTPPLPASMSRDFGLLRVHIPAMLMDRPLTPQAQLTAIGVLPTEEQRLMAQYPESPDQLLYSDTPPEVLCTFESTPLRLGQVCFDVRHTEYQLVAEVDYLVVERHSPDAVATISQASPEQQLAADLTEILHTTLGQQLGPSLPHSWTEPGWEAGCNLLLHQALDAGDLGMVATCTAIMLHHGWRPSPIAAPTGSVLALPVPVERHQGSCATVTTYRPQRNDRNTTVPLF